MVKNSIKIIWTFPAKKDLKSIFKYISELSKEAAFCIVDNILNKTEILKDGFTDIGQQEPLLADRPDIYRYLIEGNYKIIYKAKGNKIFIVAVFDVRQNPTKMRKKVK